jgi:hypothetical protein
MLDRHELDRLTLLTATKVGDEIPPSTPDDQRRIQADEFASWIEGRVQRQIADQAPFIIVSVVGLDVVGKFTFPRLPKEAIGVLITFDRCRFRHDFHLIGNRLKGSLTLSNTIAEATIAFALGSVSERLALKAVQADSVLLNYFDAREVGFERVQCAAGKFVGIQYSRFATCDLRDCQKSVLTEVVCDSNLSVAGAAETVSIARTTVNGDLRLTADPASAPTDYRLGGCQIAGSLIVGLNTPESDQDKSDLQVCSKKDFQVSLCEVSNDISIKGLRNTSFNFLSTNVHGEFRCSSSFLTSLALHYCKIEHDFDLSQTQLDGPIVLFDVIADGRLDWYHLRQSSGLKEDGKGSNHYLTARGCRFGDVAWRGCNFEFSSELKDCQISRDLRLSDTKSRTQIFNNVSIEGDTVIQTCDFDSFSLERSTSRSLMFDLISKKDPIAKHMISLRGSHFGRLVFGAYEFREDPAAMLPPQMDMVGCTYESLPVIDSAKNGEARWRFMKKLARSGYAYDPQPYYQLARQMRVAGRISEANRLQFEERQQAKIAARIEGRWPQYLGLLALRWTIGYGIGAGYFWSLLWVLFFTVAGALVLAHTPVTDNLLMSWLWRLGASFEQVFPLAKLSPHYTAFFEEKIGNPLTFCQNAWFAFQRLAGWLLAAFVVAGVAGLTQKPT